MAKAKNRLALPEEYLQAQCRILSFAGGRNLDTRDFSDIPKYAVKQVFNLMADQGYLKRLSGQRFQRTNLSGLKKLNEIKAEVRTFNDRQPETKSEIQARTRTTVAPKSPQPYQHQPSTKGTPTMSAEERAKKTAEIKAKILNDRDEREVKKNRVRSLVELDRLQAEKKGLRFDKNEFEASWDKHHAAVFPKKTEVKADLSHSSSPQVNKPSSRELSPADYLEPFGGLIGNAEVVSFRDGKSINLSGVSAVSSVQLQAEGVLLAGSDLSFDGVTVEAKKVGNRFAISNELLSDNPAVVGASVRAAQQAFVRYLDEQALNGSDIVSGDNIADHASIAQRNVASVAAFTLNDLHAAMAAHDNEGEDLVLALNPSFYSSVIQDLEYAAGHKGFERVGSEIYCGSHRVVFSNALASPSASASGSVLAVCGSLKDGLVLAERSPVTVSRHDQILAANDQALFFVGGRYGIAVRRPEALSRIQIA